MPSVYQKASLNAMLAMFLEFQGYPLPQEAQINSASSLSRFLNVIGNLARNAKARTLGALKALDHDRADAVMRKPSF